MENQLKEFEELLVDYFAGNLSEEDSRRLCTLMKSDRIYRQKYEEMAKVRAKSFVPRFENEKKRTMLNSCQNCLCIPIASIQLFLYVSGDIA